MQSSRIARVALVFALLVPGGCSVPPPTDPATLTVGFVGNFSGLDPALNDTAEAYGFAREALETLVRLRPGSFDLEPGIARSWQVAPDHLTWTFELTPGKAFSDGTAVDAAAVVANLNRWRNSSDALHWGHDYPGYLKYFGGVDTASIIDSVTAAGAMEVQIHTRTPMGSLPRALTIPAFSIGSSTAMTVDRQVYEDVPTGSGPYRASDFVAGEYVTLDRNAHYFGAPPAPPEIVLRTIPDPATEILVLEKDDIDLVANMQPDWTRDANARTDTMRIVRWPSDATCYLAFASDRPPFDSLKVRQAVAEAIDRSKVAADFDDVQLAPAASWFPPGMLGFDASAPALRYDPARAKAALAGLASTPIVLFYPDAPTALLPNPGSVAQDIASDLETAGLKVSIQANDPAGTIPVIPGGALQLSVAEAPSGDPDELISALATSWHDSGFAAIAANGKSTVDEATRAGIYRNLAAYVVNDAGAVPLVHPAFAAGISLKATASLDAAIAPPSAHR